MIGKNIAALRKKHKLTQIEFAERVHVTQGAVSQWETGRTNPDTFQLIQIAKLFDVDLKELTGNEDMPSAVTFYGKVTQEKITGERTAVSQARGIDLGHGESAITYPGTIKPGENIEYSRSVHSNTDEYIRQQILNGTNRETPIDAPPDQLGLEYRLHRLSPERRKQALDYIKFLEMQDEEGE